MGDHHIGKAMGMAATMFWEKHGNHTVSRDLAIEVLDSICNQYRGRDAEFEASDPKNPSRIHPDYANYTDPHGPIGKLIIIAFDAKPEEIDLGDEDSCPWFDGPYMRFIDRYSFC